ncbi:MAG TPA: IPT/TIG domain-containing protein [Solirubrobacteraceae bacterium]
MARMTEQAVGHDALLDRAGRRAARTARPLHRLGLALLAIALLAGALSASASARINGGPLSSSGLAPIGAAGTEKAPKVTAQPASATVEEGQPASFNAAASGVPTPTVQWEVSTNAGVSWSPIPGATSAPLTIAAAITTESGYQFRAVFKNALGSATTKAATLTVRRLPAVITQPVSIIVEEGQSATFEAAASGFPAPTVQWETSVNAGASWSNVAGATSNKLTLAAVKTSSNGQEYRATFKNTAGSVASEAATLTVQKQPAITKQPVSATLETGQSVIFEATASGFPAPTVQWEISIDHGGSWQQLAGANANQLSIPAVSVSEDGYQYRAVFQNTAGSVTSAVATLTVRDIPVVTQQPSNTTVEVGEAASFEATASGYPAPTVQWETSTNGGSTWSPVGGATADLLTVAHTVVSESGHEYRAAFTNLAGKSTSTAATLTVATTHYNAVAWGQNVFRQLGDGTVAASSNVPVQVVGLKFVTAVAAGDRHSLALLADGSVVAWGNNEYGQLGDGLTNTSNVPVAVSGVSGVKAISAGGNHSLALLSNGTVVAWGDNESGQLGNGSTISSETAVPVKGLTGVKAISAGGSHSLALMNNGTVMAWGENESGQLGTGGTKSSSVPVPVKGLTGISAISAGGDFSLALLAKGTVESWGGDEFGQLDNSGSIEAGSSDTAVPAEGLSAVSSVAAGAGHALALLGNGTVVGWGADASGQLGNGVTKAVQETPVAVTGLSGASAISAGGQASAALLGSGSIMTWGSNTWGTLGDGVSGAPSDVPVTALGLQKAASVSVGGEHMLAYGEPTPTISGVSPNLGPAAGGTVVTISGADFTGATAVRFGAAEASNVTVNSATSITATAPAGSGTVDVTVSTPAGLSLITPVDHYTYELPPSVTKLSVKSGPVSGGTAVTITGAQFTGVTKVSFGGVQATSFTVNSTTSITAVAPAAVTAGTVDVTVTNGAGSSPATSQDHFKYTPIVEAVTPPSGSTAGGETVTVTGLGFAPGTTGTSLKFGAVKAKSVSCASPTSCTVVVPPGTAGAVDVTATVNKAVSPHNPPADRFTYS